MSFRKNALLITATVVCFSFININAEARSFKAKYYKECYAPVTAIEPLLEEKSGIGGSAKTMAKAGGLFGRVGGFVGLGGVASTVGKASSAVNTVNKYSTIISDVSAFMSQMKKDHPESNDRFAAYGDKMIKEAEDLDKVQLAIEETQNCYDDAYIDLAKKMETKELKKKKAKKRLKEIQKGTKSAGKKLLVTMKRLNTNINSYEQAMNKESSSLGLNFGTLGNMAANKLLKSNTPAVPAKTTRSSSFGSLNKLAGLAGVRPSVGTYVAAGVASNIADQAANADKPQLTESEQAAQDMLPGLQRAGMSSRKYLDLYDAVSERVADQKILEAKVKKRPW